ncbi:N-acetylglucosamine-6-phosphate deacetylase [Caldivirga sp. UBA161]|uniref:N-acetylglucosamine-6-phosphate deacetylase n=1 Tax=Caldivirga sp. UBA161 TaxID=1915569 RepID=UPI0025B9E42D|nr:N-acetylglucosamine-6-phosphate deacetylase [Caldivirga sp. UBA161]
MVQRRIRVDKLYTPMHVLHDAVLVVDNGKVIGLEEGGSFDIDYRGYSAAPGLVDTHTHGCGGVEVTLIKTVAELGKLAECYARFGVTSFLPTTVSAPHETLINVANVVRQYKGNEVKGARVLGLNLEGPYINPKRKGAQNPSAIRLPNINEFNQYYEASGGLIRIMTIAPEVEGALSLIQHLSSIGVIASIGHTDANYETVMKAITLGASRATHLFDAMTGIHHRELGAAMALLDSEDVYIELITDLIHLRPETILFSIRYAGLHRVLAITDSISAAGLGEGEYELGGLRVIVKGGRATLPDGTLAGSVLTMDNALRNLVKIGLRINDALRLTSTNPAQSIGEHNIGCLKPGCLADFIVLDDALRIMATYVNGTIVYTSEI